MNELRYDEIAVNDSASFSETITPALVAGFIKLSGDMNPLHADAVYAATTTFGKTIAHGMIAGVFFSRLIGMHLPGKYSLYLSQTLRFHEPIVINHKIIISGKVTHKTDAHKTIVVAITMEDVESKKSLVSGEAMVKLLQ